MEMTSQQPRTSCNVTSNTNVSCEGNQLIQSSQSTGNWNSDTAVNLPSSIPNAPLTLQMSALNTVQVPIGPINSPQVGLASNLVTAVQAMPQQYQPNTGGGIIVLNVGNGNNLAATINQLVAGGLVQQQPQLSVVQPPTQAIQVSQVPNTISATRVSAGNTTENTQVPVTTTNSTTLTSLQTVTSNSVDVVTTGTMNRSVTNGSVGQQLMQQQQPQIAVPQTTMMMNAPMQFSIPAQQPQQQQQAFMLVPIPQMPAGQNPQQANPGSPFVSLQNQHQPLIQTQSQQPQILFNLQNQMMGNFQGHPQVQNIQQMTPGQAITINQQHQQGLQQAVNLASQSMPINNAVSPSLLSRTIVQQLGLPAQTTQSLPRTDELRAFLTKSSGGNIVTASQPTMSVAASTVSQAATGTLYRTNSNVSSPTALHTPIFTTPVQSPSTSKISLNSPQFQPTVSSPGLAFLAQVSSLSANQPTSLNEVTGTTSCSTVTQSSPVFQRSHLLPNALDSEVNNNSVVTMSLNNTKSSGAPPTPESNVSSTTKLGDDSNSLVVEGTSGNDETDIILHEITERNNFALPDNLSTRADEKNFTIKKVNPEKRKKKSSCPPAVKEKRKKGPAPKLDGTEICLICGDHASGYHYNTLSCEGCKGFFRRMVIKGAKYECKAQGDCQMDLYMRRKCQKCRFEKCKLVGMREECVLSEEKKKAKRECDSTVSPKRSLSSSDDPTIPTLTSQQRNLLELLKANERRFQWPTTEDMKKVTVWVDDDDSIHSRALRFAHFTELCILIVQLVVEFTKQLPGFLTVLREDQIVLLKACAIEVLLLRAAKQYNKHDGTINFLNGMLYDKSCFYRAGMQVEFVDPIFQFCNSMAQLDLDETEYAILVAINTFSTDRPHIKDIEKVECMQDPYVELLRVYCKIRHPNEPLMFPRILMKMVELRTLNNYHSEQMFALKVQDRKLPPLLAEIWDM